MNSSRRWLLCALTALALSGGLHATTLSFVGDLTTDATFRTCGAGCTLVSPGDFAQFAAVVENFTLAAPFDVTAITFSYGGGVNGQGATILHGGFEPYFSLFDSAGDFLASSYTSGCPATANLYNGNCYDVEFAAGVLPTGTYSIALSEYTNISYAENLGGLPYLLSDGFTGLGNLYTGEDTHYAFDVVINDASPVPEPATFPGICLTLLLLGVARRREVSMFLKRNAGVGPKP